MASVVSREGEDTEDSGSTSPDCSANMWMSCGENARSRLALSPMAISSKVRLRRTCNASAAPSTGAEDVVICLSLAVFDLSAGRLASWTQFSA